MSDPTEITDDIELSREAARSALTHIAAVAFGSMLTALILFGSGLLAASKAPTGPSTLLELPAGKRLVIVPAGALTSLAVRSTSTGVLTERTGTVEVESLAVRPDPAPLPPKPGPTPGPTPPGPAPGPLPNGKYGLAKWAAEAAKAYPIDQRSDVAAVFRAASAQIRAGTLRTVVGVTSFILEETDRRLAKHDKQGDPGATAAAWEEFRGALAAKLRGLLGLNSSLEDMAVAAEEVATGLEA